MLIAFVKKYVSKSPNEGEKKKEEKSDIKKSKREENLQLINQTVRVLNLV